MRMRARAPAAEAHLIECPPSSLWHLKGLAENVDKLLEFDHREILLEEIRKAGNIRMAVILSPLFAMGCQLEAEVMILRRAFDASIDNGSQCPEGVTPLMWQRYSFEPQYIKVFKAENGEGTYDSKKNGTDMRAEYETDHPDDVGADAKAFQDARSEVKGGYAAHREPY